MVVTISIIVFTILFLYSVVGMVCYIEANTKNMFPFMGRKKRIQFKLACGPIAWVSVLCNIIYNLINKIVED